MGQMHVSYRGSGDNGHRLSDAIWRDPRVPNIEEIINGQVDGWVLDDDFVKAPTFASATEEDGYTTYQDTGVTIKGATGSEAQGGVLEIAGNDADNDEGSIQLSHGPFVISDTAAEEFGFAFEARIKKASIADNALGLFLGMAEPGFAVADALTDDDAVMADKDHIGFHTDQADGDALDFVYTKSGQTDTVQIAGVHTWVADTYVKVGFLYLPTNPGDKRIMVFVNGVEQSTYITATEIATADFPDGEELAPALATKVGADAEVKCYLDRWRAMQWAVNT